MEESQEQTVVSGAPQLPQRDPAPAKPVPDVVTIRQQVSHRSGSYSPTGFVIKFSHALNTKEQVYSRTTSIDEEYKKIDIGWVTEHGISWLIIFNEEPYDGSHSKKVIELSVECEPDGMRTAFGLILPQEDCRLRPSDVGSLYIRSTSGKTRYTVYAIPN